MENETPPCFWCARSEVYETVWQRDKEGFWRCSWGHLADINQVETLNSIRSEKLDKQE